MTLAELLAEFRVRAPECTSTRVSDAILTRWLNEAQGIVCRKAGCLKTKAYTATVANQQEYALPDDLLLIDPDGGVMYYDASEASYRKLRPLTMDWLDQHVGDWRNAASSPLPEGYYRRGSVLGIYPKPDNSSDAIHAYYWENADNMSTGPDIPFNEDNRLKPYHDVLLYYALSKAKETSDEHNKAKYYKEQFEIKTNQMIAETTADYDTQEAIFPYYK